LARQIVSALYKLHVEARVIHRDIKPENMMLLEKNKIVLVDFGLSKIFKEEEDQLKGTAGTMKFYAPEIVRTGVKNKVIHGRQVDVWAAGISIFNLASGKFPYTATSVMEMQEQLL
jgi:serine/threonine protein kinase